MSTPAPLGEVRTVPIRELKPAANNPRVIPQRAVEAVAKSIERFGWQQPIVVDADMVVLAGHTRLKAARYLELHEVPVVVTELEGQAADAFRIADNRTGDYSAWDYPVLVDQLEELADEFSDTLAMEDWQAIIEELEETTEEAEKAREASEMEGQEDDGTRELTVVCMSEAAAVSLIEDLSADDGIVSATMRGDA